MIISLSFIGERPIVEFNVNNNSLFLHSGNVVIDADIFNSTAKLETFLLESFSTYMVKPIHSIVKARFFPVSEEDEKMLCSMYPLYKKRNGDFLFYNNKMID